MVKALIPIALLCIMTGCASVPSSSFCDIARPNRDPVEDMTPAEARTALALNLKGQALCQWVP